MSQDSDEEANKKIGVGLLITAMVLSSLHVLGPVLLAVPMVVMLGGAAEETNTTCTPAGGDRPSTTAAVEVPEALKDDPPSVDVTEQQIEVAYITWSVAHQLGFGDKGAVIGIITAAQESTLGANEATRTPNEDNDVGPFQQRALPGWYADGVTMEENTKILNDPANGARIFFEGRTVDDKTYQAALDQGIEPAGPPGYHIPGLRDVKGWEDMAETEAAQTVQVSAFPDAYQKHVPMAQALVAAFAESGDAPPLPEDVAPQTAGSIPDGQDCAPAGAGGGDLGECPAPNLPQVEKGLTPDALLVLSCMKAKFPEVTEYLGVGDRPAGVDDDHQTGRAIDAMTTDMAVGTKIAEWAKANASALGIKYIIWDEQIWSQERAAEGWRQCGTAEASCYSGPDDTQAHRDHVHVSVFGDMAKPPSGGSSPMDGPVVLPLAPGDYWINSVFGQPGSWSSGYHRGTDWMCETGKPIYAIVDGRVSEVLTDDGGPYGNSVLIQSGGGVTFRYSHMNKVMTRNGAEVKAGDQIGECGWTGRVIPKDPSAAHLDLELTVNGELDDSEKWLRNHGVEPRQQQ